MDPRLPQTHHESRHVWLWLVGNSETHVPATALIKFWVNPSVAPRLRTAPCHSLSRSEPLRDLLAFASAGLADPLVAMIALG